MRYHIPLPLLPVQSNVVFDQATTSGYQAAVSSYSFSHIVGAGLANRCLVVGVSILATGTVTGITYAGVAMTFERAEAEGVYRAEIWRLVAPATSSNTVEVTLSGASTMVVNVASYSGVDQSSPVDVTDGAHGISGGGVEFVTGAPFTTINQTRSVGMLATSDTSVTIAYSSTTASSQRATANGALGLGELADKGLIRLGLSSGMGWDGFAVGATFAIVTMALKPVQSAATFLRDVIRSGGVSRRP